MVKFDGKIVEFGFGAVGKSFFEKLSKEIDYNELNYYVITKDDDEFKAYMDEHNKNNYWYIPEELR